MKIYKNSFFNSFKWLSHRKKISFQMHHSKHKEYILKTLIRVNSNISINEIYIDVVSILTWFVRNVIKLICIDDEYILPEKDIDMMEMIQNGQLHHLKSFSVISTFDYKIRKIIPMLHSLLTDMADNIIYCKLALIKLLQTPFQYNSNLDRFTYLSLLYETLILKKNYERYRISVDDDIIISTVDTLVIEYDNYMISILENRTSICYEHVYKFSTKYNVPNNMWFMFQFMFDGEMHLNGNKVELIGNLILLKNNIAKSKIDSKCVLEMKYMFSNCLQKIPQHKDIERIISSYACSSKSNTMLITEEYEPEFCYIRTIPSIQLPDIYDLCNITILESVTQQYIINLCVHGINLIITKDVCLYSKLKNDNMYMIQATCVHDIYKNINKSIIILIPTQLTNSNNWNGINLNINFANIIIDAHINKKVLNNIKYKHLYLHNICMNKLREFTNVIPICNILSLEYSKNREKCITLTTKLKKCIYNINPIFIDFRTQDMKFFDKVNNFIFSLSSNKKNVLKCSYYRIFKILSYMSMCWKSDNETMFNVFRCMFTKKRKREDVILIEKHKFESLYIETYDLNTKCPICFELNIDARQLICGHIICVSCIESIIYHRPNFTCPICRKPFKSLPIKTTVPSYYVEKFNLNSTDVFRYMKNEETNLENCDQELDIKNDKIEYIKCILDNLDGHNGQLVIITNFTYNMNVCKFYALKKGLSVKCVGFNKYDKIDDVSDILIIKYRYIQQNILQICTIVEIVLVDWDISCNLNETLKNNILTNNEKANVHMLLYNSTCESFLGNKIINNFNRSLFMEMEYYLYTNTDRTKIISRNIIYDRIRNDQLSMFHENCNIRFNSTNMTCEINNEIILNLI